MPRQRRWTDEQLTAAVAASKSLAEVMRRLGLQAGKYDAIRKHIARLEVPAGHLRMERGVRRRGGWSDVHLVTAVAESTTYADVMRRLGYTPSGGAHRWIKANVVRLGLSTGHFTGQASNQGRRFRGRGQPLAEILVQGSTYSTGKLRQRLIADGYLDPECAECGLREWRRTALSLMLDHINGDHTDHRLSNLRILCPNCHSQTPTWCNRERVVA